MLDPKYPKIQKPSSKTVNYMLYTMCPKPQTLISKLIALNPKLSINPKH